MRVFPALAGMTGDEHVYLPADAAQTLFQSEALVELVGSKDALVEQMASGELSIPMSQWMAVVPYLPNRNDITHHARTAADGMSPADLENFDADALFAELGGRDTTEAAARATPEQAEVRQKIEQDVMGQLVVSGRYSQSSAKSQARLFAAGSSSSWSGNRYWTPSTTPRRCGTCRPRNSAH